MTDVRGPAGSGGFGTRVIRAATRGPEVEQSPSAVPIYQAAAFHAEDMADLAEILAFDKPGYSYSRIENPTASALAAAFAELHGAEAGFAFGSGMAVIHAAILSLVQAGDRIVCTRAVYGSTRALLSRVFARLGVDVAYVDPVDLPAVDDALSVAPTRLLYLETIANPTIVVADLAPLCELAHRHRAAVVVDNTFASPYLCAPTALGADLVVESATKWLGGHSDVIAGVVAGRRELIEAVRAAAVDTGGIVAPFSAFLVLRGMQTLHVRMDRHSASALAIARHLEAQPRIGQVVYPGLPSHPQAAVARRQLRAGGGMLAFDLGSRSAAVAFLEALRIPPRTATLGSVVTYAVHPPTTTHRQLSDPELLASGIPPGLVRLSVGLEDVDDLIADIDSALAAATEPGTGA
jgi:methionine-gamma-lyase